MEVVKCTVSDILLAKSTQYAVRHHALALTNLSCIHNALD